MTSDRALITGASSGIGLALARQFAKNGNNLVITARDGGQLQTVADELSLEYGARTTIITRDLADENAAQEIFDEVRRLGVHVHTLVNNAGLGQRGRFSDMPLERDVMMIRVNAEAVVRMTKLFLPAMLERGSGRILNVASVAGFEPGPLLAVYHATKSFVISFSVALREELKHSNITVTALCPGATDTDFFSKGGMTRTRLFQRIKLMSADAVAEAGYKALTRRSATECLRRGDERKRPVDRPGRGVDSRFPLLYRD
jgi:short-subunit dehydrogenase